MESDWPAQISSYDLNYPIGQGACGLVWSATVMDGAYADKEVALKIIDLDKFEDFNIDELKKEINIMSECQHSNLISSYISFIDKSELCIVMPLIDAGSCLDVLNTNFSKGITDELVIATIMREVLQGLAYLHQNGEIHRDLKAGNMFAEGNGNIYLGDFGVSASMKKGEKRKTFVGSPCWMAPEVIEQYKGYDFSADIWSIGITCIELAEGEAPYMGMSAMKIIMSVINSDPPTLTGSHFSKEFKDFVSLCLQKDPAKRPSAEKLLKHKFIHKAEDPSYLVSEFLAGIDDLKDRIGDRLRYEGEEFIAQRKKKNKKKKAKKSKHKKKKKDKRDKRDQGDSNGGPWDFGSGSYNTTKAKAKLKGKHYSSDDDPNDHKCEMSKVEQPSNIEDDFDDLGLNSDEN